MLWPRKDRYGRGSGGRLVAHLESELHRRAARLLIVETSGLPALAVARSSYASSGFKHEATIKSFFAERDGKLVSTKPLTWTKGCPGAAAETRRI